MHINTNGMTMGSLFKFLWIGNLAGWFCFFALGFGIYSRFRRLSLDFQEPSEVVRA
jgi:hypothetical protein